MVKQRLILLAGLCWLLMSCSTTPYNYARNDTTTKKGMRYLLGRGVAKNDNKAFYYFHQAAQKENDLFAQNEIAYMYLAGKGTEPDPKKALSWYQKAAKRGLASAEYNLGLMYVYGLGTQANKTLGLEWIKKSADHGFLPAREELGLPS